MLIDLEKKKTAVSAFIEKYRDTVTECNICPHRCGVDRRTVMGRCHEPYLPRVSSFNLHTGEEPPISGTNGSGTIFLAGCNMNCVYCQNFPISQMHKANRELPLEELADLMLNLQSRGAHNINFVTPSHYVYQIVCALSIALQKGFSLPIVYNTSGYDSIQVVKDLQDIVDIYLPDIKYIDSEISWRYSRVKNYFEVDSLAVAEMFRQTGGNLLIDDSGIAYRGIIIRHLVMPSNTENSKAVLHWIADNLSNHVHLAVMAQYFPAYQVNEEKFPDIARRLCREEYDEILDYVEGLGFENVWFQEFEEV